MTHDPLCPRAIHPEFCEGCTPACGTCQCDLIAKARADERRQAGARVASRPYWEDDWDENVVMNRSSAIDAAEGGDGA